MKAADYTAVYTKTIKHDGDKIITGAQPKVGTGLKMQTLSVVFSTLHC